MSGDGYNLYWHVPIDDTHHWRYDIVFRRSAPMEEKDIRRNQEILDELNQDYRPKRNKANRYLQDRESMKTWSFAGMGTDLQRPGHRRRRRHRPDRRSHPGIS